MNRSSETTANGNSDRIARAAWFCAFVLPLALAAMLLGVKSAQAAPSPSGVVPLAFEEELFEDEEELGLEDELEFAEEECQIAEEEAAEGEISAAEAKAICKEAEEAAREAAAGSSNTASAKCPIRSASAHASRHKNRLKLTIGYTTNSPVLATFQIHNFGTFKRHLGKSGVLRFSKKLHKQRGRLAVHIKLPRSERAGCPSRRLVLFPR